ncbi:Hda3p [Sugiyamaella lignohabitans]|uniref:Hda3p n=1 Tax=Sugiyamaella lignohabitans TaxID=796027 RepID=A0A167CYV7_9ASCO|nr:Hda3p [Sugiyamaella lignohabitans]ANB12272.1 Hda3p [Sugiyamaella lignohabitans]
MDLGKILDGTPEPILTVPDTILFESIAGAGVNGWSGDHSLAVPMTEFQKELTDQVISSHYSDILKFFETDGPVMVESLHTLYTNAQLVATHPFLLVDHYLPKNLLLREVPLRLQHASGKFKILGDILDIIKEYRITVGLVSRPGKTLDLVEAYLQGKFVNYIRHSGSQLRDTGKIDPKYSTIHLIASSELDSNYPGDERFDLIIAFDQTFSINDHHIAAIRRNGRPSQSLSSGGGVGSGVSGVTAGGSSGSGQDQPLTPVIRLIPANSIEHIYLKVKRDWDASHTENGHPLSSGVHSVVGVDHGHGSLDSVLSGDTFTDATNDVQFLRRVLAGTVVLRGKVGAIPNDLKPIYAQNLKPLAKWLQTCSTAWPLPDLADIPEYSAADVERTLLTEVHGDDAYSVSVSSHRSSPPAGWSRSSHTNGSGVSRKGSIKHERSKLSDHEYYNAKRLKRETDSVEYPSLGTSDPLLVLQMSNTHSISDGPPHHTSVLTHRLLRRLEDVINENSTLKAEIRSYRAQASSRQKEYEGLLEEIADKILIIGDLETRVKAAERKTERSIADLVRSDEKVSKLTEELKQTKSIISSTEVPEKKLLDEQTAKIAELNAEIHKLEERVESRNAENEYMRTEYQKASSAAVEAHNQISELEQEKKALEKKVQSEAVRLRTLSFDEERFQKDQTIRELTSRVAALEEHLKRILGSDRHTNNSLSRSRYTSRASSVPRRTRSPGSSGVNAATPSVASSTPTSNS